jgi:hypothetical protein
MSKQMWTAMGDNVGVAFGDQTHLSGYGGYLLSKLIVKDIKENVPGLARYVVDDFVDMDPTHPEPPPAYLRQSGGPGLSARAGRLVAAASATNSPAVK